MNNRAKKRLRGTAATAAVITGLYHASPKLHFVQHTFQKEAAEALDPKVGLDSTYTHEDKETTILLNTLAGFVDKEQLTSILKKEYDFTDKDIALSEDIKPDVALYKALREMNVKYGNPKVTFKGNYKNYKTFKYQHKRANFTSNTIHLHNIKGMKFHFTDPWQSLIETNEDKIGDKIDFKGDDYQVEALGENRQIYLINNRIAELSHAVQLQRDGEIESGMDIAGDYIRGGFNYDKLYDKKRSIEYEAHNIIEQKLCYEFIETYKKNCDMNNERDLLTIGLFYSGYFNKNIVDAIAANHYFHLAANQGNSLGIFLIGKTTYNQWRKIAEVVYKNGDTTVSADTLALLKRLEGEARTNLTIAGQKGLGTGAYSLLAKMGNYMKEPYCDIEYSILRAKALHKKVKKTKKDGDYFKLALCYQHIAKLYRKVGHELKGEEYDKKANKIAGDMGITLSTEEISHGKPL